MLKIFGTTYLNSWGYMEKHLNRQKKVRMSIPQWQNGKFVENLIMWIEEAPKNKMFEINVKDIHGNDVKIATKYIYNIVDKQLNQRTASGFAESRKELMEKYLKLMYDSYNYYNVMMGKGL